MSKILKTLLISATIGYTPWLFAANQQCEKALEKTSFNYNQARNIELNTHISKSCYEKLAKEGKPLAKYLTLSKINKDNIDEYITLAQDNLTIAQFRLFEYYLENNQFKKAMAWGYKLFTNAQLSTKFKQVLTNIATYHMMHTEDNTKNIYWNIMVKRLPNYNQMPSIQKTLLQTQFQLMKKYLIAYNDDLYRNEIIYWTYAVKNNPALTQDIPIQKNILNLYEELIRHYSYSKYFNQNKHQYWLDTIEGDTFFVPQIQKNIPNIYMDSINDYAIVNNDEDLNRFKTLVHALENSRYFSSQDLKAQNVLLNAEYKIIKYYANQKNINNAELKVWINKIETNPTLASNKKMQNELFNIYFSLAEKSSINNNPNIHTVTFYLNIINNRQLPENKDNIFTKDAMKIVQESLLAKHYAISLPWITFLTHHQLINFENIYPYFDWSFDIAQYDFNNNAIEQGNLVLQQLNDFEKFPTIAKQKNNPNKFIVLKEYIGKKYISAIQKNLVAKHIPVAELFFIQLINSPFIVTIPNNELIQWFDSFINYNIQHDNPKQIEFYLEQLVQSPYLKPSIKQELLIKCLTLLSINKQFAFLQTHEKNLTDTMKANILNNYLNSLTSNAEKLAFLENSVLGTSLASFDGFSAKNIINNINATKLQSEKTDKTAIKEKQKTQPLKKITTYKLTTDLLFAFNKASLTKKGLEAVDEVAHKLIKIDAKQITVSGFTDDIGEKDYNLQLSQRRADTVKARLIADGVKVKIHAVGYGASNPIKICPNNLNEKQLEACLAPNRRVEISSYGILGKDDKVQAGDGLQLQTKSLPLN